jgi:single-strand DNA-binding protein
MSASISILGNTGGNAELRYSQEGLPIASFSIASNSFRKTQEGKIQVTEWFNVTAFGKVAEVLAANVKKGTQLLVLGKLTFKPWVTKNNELQSFEVAGGNRNGNGNGNADVSVDMAAQEPSYTGPSVETATSSEPFANQF